MIKIKLIDFVFKTLLLSHVTITLLYRLSCFAVIIELSNEGAKYTVENHLKSIRERKGLSQEFVANHLHVTRQTISRWENDHNMPPVLALDDLANFYEVSITNLIGEDVVTMHKKINLSALIGALVFNLPIGAFSIIFISMILIAIGAMSLMGFCIPFIFIYSITAGGELFSWFQLGFSILMFALAFPLACLTVILVKYTYSFLIAYVRYNIKTIFYQIASKSTLANK